MNYNRILRILCSLPVILVIGFFVPFIGVCLIIARLFLFKNRKRYFILVSVIVAGILIAVPVIISEFLKIINSSTEIFIFETIINFDIYPRLLNYGKFLVLVGTILLILAFAFRQLLDKLYYYIDTYLSRKEQIYEKVTEKNDMEIKIKQEKARNMQVVYCKFCGADNLFTETIGECEYCGRKLSVKEKV